ncbi:MAG: hypothetical protein ACRD1K_19070 [Acidimicrobiales bacterium]
MTAVDAEGVIIKESGRKVMGRRRRSGGRPPRLSGEVAQRWRPPAVAPVRPGVRGRVTGRLGAALGGADAVHLASALTPAQLGSVLVTWDLRLRAAALGRAFPSPPGGF